MKKLFYPVALVLILVSSAFTFISVQNWDIGNDYSVKFSNKKAEGVFKELNGNIVFDEKNPSSSKFDITINTASINTGNGLKNRHAKNKSWFDVEKYPVIHFVSSSVVKVGSAYQITGELEMHGVKKPLTIPFSFQSSGTTGVFKGSFKVNGTDFGVGEAKGNENDWTALEVTVPVTSK